jgi:DNA invertase Pin-like site-specific DNA recombinase
MFTIAYLRSSTRTQLNSIDVQRQEIFAWATTNKITVSSLFEDFALSGALPVTRRPGLAGAMNIIRSCRVGRLVVTRYDRLARDASIINDIQHLMDEYNCALVVLQPSDISAAQIHRDLIRKDTKAALALKKSKGERVGTIPFGFSATPDGKLITNEDEQRVIERIRHLRKTNSIRAIVRKLDTDGIKSRTGNPFSRGSVENILRKI